MNVLSQTAKLKEALDRFQADLDARVSDGDQDDVRAWLKSTHASFESLERVLIQQRQRVHERLFSQVANQDASEIAHVRELRKWDAEIKKLLELVKTQFIALEVTSATDVESRVEQEPFDESATMEIVDRGLELVHWIRAQELAVTTWFTETFADK